MHIIIAELNKKNGYEDFYEGSHEPCYFEINHLCKTIKEYMTNKGVQNFKISTAYDFSDLTELIEGYDGRILIFSNFPPNGTYKPHFVEIKHGKRLVPADGYLWSTHNFHKLLLLSSRIELHFITGAPVSKLPDFQVLALSQCQKITIKRKKDWLDEGNYLTKYENYVIEKIDESIAKNR